MYGVTLNVGHRHRRRANINPAIKNLRNKSYTHFDKQIFIEDLERNNMQTCTNSKNINAAWKLLSDGFTDILDEHASIKERRV